MKKLFYPPGIISLIGVFFFFTYFPQKMLPQKETVILLAYPKESDPRGNEMPYFNVAGIEEDINRKRKISFLLDEDLLTNKKKLDIVRFEARRLKYTFDTSSVILVSLSENTSYGEFVNLINICLSDSIRRYGTWGNYLQFLASIRPEK